MPTKTGSHGASYDHHHPMSLEDTSDFMNTLELESGALVDRFVSFDDAAGWLSDRGICHEDLAPEALATYGRTPEEALDHVKSVRGALREVADAVAHDRAPSDRALDEVNRAIRSRERVESRSVTATSAIRWTTPSPA
jgi:hypothetical protein